MSRAPYLSLLILLVGPSLAAQEPLVELEPGITIRLIDVDVRATVQTLARFLDRPVVFGPFQPRTLTIEAPAPVPRDSIESLLRTTLEANGLALAPESGVFIVRELRPPPEPVVPEPASTTSIGLHVIRLRHAPAASVAGIVNALYGRPTALGEIGDSPPTLGQEIDRLQAPEAPADPPSTRGPTVAAFSGTVTIVPDPSTNSLLVRASDTDLALIQAAVDEIDVRPLQVLIEVLIVEARKDRSFAFGVDAELPPTKVPGSTDTEVSGSNTGLGLADFALRLLNVGGVDLDLMLSAAASRGDVSIVSRPIVFAANNETANILVGSQRPFVQVQRSLPTDAPSRDQVVQYRDVGTRLSVRPTISHEGHVSLQVTQEVNAATTETAFDAPIISTRTVQTTLLVRDGQTAVLGGLTDRQVDESSSGVPVLSSIPLLGGLFGRTSERVIETELFVFLTPRVIPDDEAMTDLVDSIRPDSTQGGR